MNEQNLIPNSQRSPSEVRANGQKGGIASGKARRERKTLADALRAELDKPLPDTGMTKREYLAAKCLADLSGRVTPKDLRTLADVLGELKVNLNVQGEGRIVVVRSEEERQKIEDIGNIGA